MSGGFETAVVGAGPCGVAAAVQLQRSGCRPVLFERREVGGLLRNANRIENYPGISRGIAGPHFCRLLERHLRAVGVRLIFDEVVSIRSEENGFFLTTARGTVHGVKGVVLATGTRPVRNVVPGEEALAGRRVFYEARDLLPHAEGREVAILGASDAAYDYALNLAARACRVTLLHRGERSCLPLLATRAALAAIPVRWNAVLDECTEKEGRLLLRFGPRGGSLETDYLLIACGRLPENGLARTLQNGPQTAWNGSTPLNPLAGLYLGGDLVRSSFRQAAIAAGDGLFCAMAAARDLEQRRGVAGETAKSRFGPVARGGIQ